MSMTLLHYVAVVGTWSASYAVESLFSQSIFVFWNCWGCLVVRERVRSEECCWRQEVTVKQWAVRGILVHIASERGGVCDISCNSIDWCAIMSEHVMKCMYSFCQSSLHRSCLFAPMWRHAITVCWALAISCLYQNVYCSVWCQYWWHQLLIIIYWGTWMACISDMGIIETLH